MKIAIIGTGAIGSLFACRLADDKSNEILCVVKHKTHAESINMNGITINEEDGKKHSQPAGRLRAVTDTDEETPADVILVSVKANVTEEAVKKHSSLFGKDTAVVTLQNGYGNHLDIMKVTEAENIVIGTTAMGVNIAKDGSINLAGNGGTVIGALAPESERCQTAVNTIEKLFSSAGFKVRVTDNVQNAVFKKLLINVGINAVCTLNNAENRYICIDEQMNDYAKHLVFEAIDVLELEGYHFDKEETWKEVETVAQNTGDNICSMLQDSRKGRKTEIRKINGAIADIARSHNAEARLNYAITREIEMMSSFRSLF